eukprot:6350100-Pyramimonas_sp.AAC.1
MQLGVEVVAGAGHSGPRVVPFQLIPETSAAAANRLGRPSGMVVSNFPASLHSVWMVALPSTVLHTAGATAQRTQSIATVACRACSCACPHA